MEKRNIKVTILAAFAGLCFVIAALFGVFLPRPAKAAGITDQDIPMTMGPPADADHNLYDFKIMVMVKEAVYDQYDEIEITTPDTAAFTIETPHFDKADGVYYEDDGTYRYVTFVTVAEEATDTPVSVTVELKSGGASVHTKSVTMITVKELWEQFLDSYGVYDQDMIKHLLYGDPLPKEITAEDLKFASRINTTWEEFGFYDKELRLSVHESAYNAFDRITIVTEDTENFTLEKTSFEKSEGTLEGGYYNFYLKVSVDPGAVDKELEAIIAIYRGGHSVLEHTQNFGSLLDRWKSVINKGNLGDYKEEYQYGITAIVNAYNSAFPATVASVSDSFTNFTDIASTSMSVNALVFKIPRANLKEVKFRFYGEVYTTYAGIEDWYPRYINIILSASGELSIDYKFYGTDYVPVDPDNKPIGYEQILADDIFFMSDAEYLYVQIHNTDTIYANVPDGHSDGAGRVETVTATNISGETVQIQSNTNAIIYDEYNEQLLAEIERLNAEIVELQSRLTEQSAALSELEAEINGLEQTVADLEEEKAQLESAYETEKDNVIYLTAQIEELNGTIAAKETEYAELLEEYNAIKASLTGDNAELLALINSLRQENSALKDQIEDLRQPAPTPEGGESPESGCFGSIDGSAAAVLSALAAALLIRRKRHGKNDKTA